MSNFGKHLEIHISDTKKMKKKNKSLNIKPMENVELLCDEADDLKYENIETLEDYIDDDNSEWVDVSHTNDDGNEAQSEGNDDSICIIETDNYKLQETNLSFDDLQSQIYDQISTQLIQMKESSVKHKETEQSMDFMVQNKNCSLKFDKIKADNSCLFRSIEHQLNRSKLHTRTQTTASIKLRQQIVEHIKEHRKSFEMELKGSVFERSDRKKLNMSEECDYFLNHLLPKSSCWGGSETLKATMRIYSVNILIINDSDGGCYFVNGFNKHFERTLVLAYCSLHTDTQKQTEHEPNQKSHATDKMISTNNHNQDIQQQINRNHYNSVVYIEQTDVFTLTNMLATVAFRRLSPNVTC